jgi:HlyD family secretion protein
MKLALMRKYIKWLVLGAIVVVVVLRVKFTPRQVQAHTVAQQDVVAEVMGTGTLEARVKTIISPRIQERLAELLVDQNDHVKAGQVLARLDDGELRRQVEVAQASLSAASATAERVRVDESRAVAVEQQARTDHQRIADLVRTKVSSAAELDKAVEQLRIAESGLLRARAATAEAQQQVVMAEKTLAYQQERLGFAQLTSPYDGLIIRRDRDPGGVVVPGSSILQLISTNEIWVAAWVDETAAAGLATGQAARVVFRSEPGRDHAGEVARLGRETDRETREFLVDVRVSTLPSNWTVGQRAEVFVQKGRKAQAIAIPQKWLQWQGGKPGVFVAKDGKADWREVSLGLRGREMVEVTQGLSVGDKIVAVTDPGQPPLKPGQSVKGK